MSGLYPISAERYELVLRSLKLEAENDRLQRELTLPIDDRRSRRVLRAVDQAQMRAMWQRGLSRREIERATGWARSTVYRETRDMAVDS